MNIRSEDLSQRNRSRAVLLLLVAVFVLPIMIAWGMVTGWFGWQQHDSVNRGSLLPQPIDLNADAPAPAALHGYNGTWSVLYVGNGRCDDGCRSDLKNLEKIHVLAGHAQTRVRMWRTLIGAAVPATDIVQDLTLAPATIDSVVDAVAKQLAIEPPFIALVDHSALLVMVYRAGVNPDDVLDDLKRLLRASDPG